MSRAMKSRLKSFQVSINLHISTNLVVLNLLCEGNHKSEIRVNYKSSIGDEKDSLTKDVMLTKKKVKH
jgi:hypothetical protein